MIMQFGKALAKGENGEELFFELALEILLAQPTCFDRSTIEPMG